MSVNLNDPKLTAYALGELDGPELREMEELVNKSEEARKYVQEVRQTAEMLQSELKSEPQLKLDDAQRAKVIGRADRSSWSLWWKPAIGFAVAAVATFVVVLPRVQQKVSDEAEGLSAPIGMPAPEANKTAQITNQAAVQDPARRTPEKSLHAQRPAASSVADSAPRQELPTEDAASYEDSAAYSGAGELSESVAEAEMASPQAQPLVAYGAKKDSLGKGSAFTIGGASKKMMAPESRGRYQFVPADESDKNFNTESYSHIQESDFLRVSDQPLSTFSIDVDTASYSILRRFLNAGTLPPPDAVRIEELVNYFPYDYAAPTGGKPFSVRVDQAIAPWNKSNSIVRIGLKGQDIDLRKKPKSNLVFLIDVSGSMNEEDKLPLLKTSLRQLIDKLDDNDRVAMVVYAGSSGLVLPSTSNKSEILAALEKLESGGSTNGGQGIELAYKTAAANFIEGGTNRVILATDGDFNVGTTNEGDLVRMIEEKAKSKIFLSVLGFGSGNLKDSTMEKLANKGNGNYAYIDTAQEAKKALVENLGGTLITIAKDVKIQVEFNPKFVAGYRLIGYENRTLAKEDFNNDAKDAGEIGSGHTVTALYEIIPAGGELPTPQVDALKYQQPKKLEKATPEAEVNDSKELLTVKLRYKEPTGDKSALMEVPVAAKSELKLAKDDLAFASSVAMFGMLLRDSKYKAEATFDKVHALAKEGTSGKFRNDPYRKEFLELVKKAKDLKVRKGQ